MLHLLFSKCFLQVKQNSSVCVFASVKLYHQLSLKSRNWRGDKSLPSQLAAREEGNFNNLMTTSLSAEHFTAEPTEINLAPPLTFADYTENEWLFSITEVHVTIEQPMLLGSYGAHKY